MTFPAWKDNPTQMVLRGDVRPGDIIHSSHGYRLLIESNTPPGAFRGRLHANPDGHVATERYPANTYVSVEVPRP